MVKRKKKRKSVDVDREKKFKTLTLFDSWGEDLKTIKTNTPTPIIVLESEKDTPSLISTKIRWPLFPENRKNDLNIMNKSVDDEKKENKSSCEVDIVKRDSISISQQYMRVENVVNDSEQHAKCLECVFLYSKKKNLSVLLKNNWQNLDVKIGDNVMFFEVGMEKKKNKNEMEMKEIIIDGTNSYLLIIHPHMLISCTGVAGSFTCMRQTVLAERIKQLDGNESALFGNMAHKVIEDSFRNISFEDKVQSSLMISRVVERHASNLWSFNHSEASAGSKLETCLDPVSDFGVQFFKEGRAVCVKDEQNNSHMIKLIKTLVNELNLWSPIFGLKGVIDSLLLCCDFDEMTRKRKDIFLPLEIKTGRVHTSHYAQVLLYSLLVNSSEIKPFEMHDNNMQIQFGSSDFFRWSDYSTDFLAGLLLYIPLANPLKSKDNNFQLRSVNFRRCEISSLILRRNELSNWLFKSGSNSLPPCNFDSFYCARCPFVQACSIYVSLEDKNGTKNIKDLFFAERVMHLKTEDLTYFANWDKLLALEYEKGQMHHKKELFSLPSFERERLFGRCISRMILIKKEVVELKHRNEQYLYTFERKCHSSSCDVCEILPIDSLSFSRGDYVVISLEDGVHFNITAGTIIKIDKSKITLLSHREINVKIMQSDTFRIDRDEMTTGSAFSRSNLISLLSNKIGNKNVSTDSLTNKRELIINLKPPEFVSISSVDLVNQDIECGQKFQMNDDQKNAMKKVLCAKDYVCIQGVPGSGKTTMNAMLIKCLIQKNEKVKILVCSYTHSAVDNILIKLSKIKVDFCRIGSSLQVAKEIQPFIIEERCSINDSWGFLDEIQVIGCTCLGVGHPVFQKLTFDYCIIDEASQITQPVCIGPILLADTFVLVGDHFQLPPLIKNVEAGRKGMETSLFQRLSRAHPSSLIMLSTQYRMNDDIMYLANSLVYEGNLSSQDQKVKDSQLQLHNFHSSKDWIDMVLEPKRKVVFVNTDLTSSWELGGEDVSSSSSFCQGLDNQPKKTPIYNLEECVFVTTLVSRLINIYGLPPSEVGVISPYRKQNQVIIEFFDKNHVHDDVEVSTVDSFQGKEKACIIISLVRKNPRKHIGKLLQNWRRINVAFTRAKSKVIIIGSYSTLQKSELFSKFIDLANTRNWILNAESFSFSEQQ